MAGVTKTAPITIHSPYYHPQHELTLTRLAAGGRCCNICKKASPAGAYMYLCEPCGGYAAHSECLIPQMRPAASGAGGGGGARAVETGVHIAGEVVHTADTVLTLVDTVSTIASCSIM